MPASRVPHLMLRGQIFYFRRAVPGRLQIRFGRSSIKASLRTHNRVTANLRCRVLIPTCIDQNPWAHWRWPMDIMVHG